MTLSQQDIQILDNVANNFWKPEPPSVLEEATSIPLSYVVSDAVKRWFDDTYRYRSSVQSQLINLCFREAARGDVKQQALLGQMLNEGYGCVKDPAAASEWIERARRRGYKMDGVYCKL